MKLMYKVLFPQQMCGEIVSCLFHCAVYISVLWQPLFIDLIINWIAFKENCHHEIMCFTYLASCRFLIHGNTKSKCWKHWDKHSAGICIQIGNIPGAVWSLVEKCKANKCWGRGKDFIYLKYATTIKDHTVTVDHFTLTKIKCNSLILE